MAWAGAAKSPSTIPVRVVDIIAKTAELNISAHGMIFGGRERCFSWVSFNSKVSAQRCLLGGVCSRQGSAHVTGSAHGCCRASCLSPLGGGTYSERLLDFTARGYLPIPRPKPICREMGLRISRGGGGAPPRDSSRARAAGNFGASRV